MQILDNYIISACAIFFTCLAFDQTTAVMWPFLGDRL